MTPVDRLSVTELTKQPTGVVKADPVSQTWVGQMTVPARKGEPPRGAVRTIERYAV